MFTKLFVKEKMKVLCQWLSMWLVQKKELCLKAFVNWTPKQPTTGLHNILVASILQTMAAGLQTISTFTLTSLFVRNIGMTPETSHSYLRLDLAKCNWQNHAQLNAFQNERYKINTFSLFSTHFAIMYSDQFTFLIQIILNSFLQGLSQCKG